MPTIHHNASSLTEEAVTKEDQEWLHDEASAECNERQGKLPPQESPPVEPPGNDNLCFGAYWLQTH